MRVLFLHRRRRLRERDLRRAVAWAVACAIALQAWASGPLAARMAQEDAMASARMAAHCANNGSGHPAPHRGEHDGAPAGGHEHQTCLLCQGGIGPLFMLAALPPPPPGMAEVPAAIVWTDRHPARLAVAANAPRGPPLNA